MSNNFIVNLIYNFFNKLNYTTVFFGYFLINLFIPELDSSVQYFYNNNHLFLIYCCISIIIVRIVFSKDFRNNFTGDLKIHFFTLKLKHFWQLINFVKINFQKIYLYLVEYKYFNNLNVIKYLITSLINLNLLWRPLFKRFSYFGNYKNSRSKFIKY